MALLMMLFGACARLRCLFNEAAPVADVYQERNSCFEGFRQCNCTPGLGPEICSGWSKYQTPTVATMVTGTSRGRFAVYGFLLDRSVSACQYV